MSEEILGIIRTMSSSGTTYYDLCFTSNRMIAAKIGSTFGIIIITDYLAMKKSEKLKKISIESILKADKKNFEIPYTEITKVEMKKPRALSVYIRIFTHTKKYKFKFLNPGKKEFDAHESLVRSVLPDKLFIS